jgi:NADH:ubiquinone oxidoreductase subunit 6 (subunit J)
MERLVELFGQIIDAHPDAVLAFILLALEILVKATTYRFITEDFLDSINQIGLDLSLIAISFLALSTTDPDSVFSQSHRNVSFAAIIWVLIFLILFIVSASLYKKHKDLPWENSKDKLRKVCFIGTSFIIGISLLFQSIVLL